MASIIHKSRDIRPLVPDDESIWQFLLRCNPELVKADKVIFQEHERRQNTLTFGESRVKAAQGAAGLAKVLGLRPGDTIGICGANSVNWVLAAYAASWAGITFAAINPLASPHEFVHYLNNASVSVLLADGAIFPKVKEAQRLDRNLANVRLVALDSASQEIPLWPRDFLSSGSSPVFDLSNRGNKDVVAAICFSSGTSGKPKGVELSHRNLIASLLASRAGIPETFNSQQVEVFYAPFCHIYGLLTAVFSAAFIGHFVLTIQAFKLHDYLKACEEKRATVMRVVPPTAMAMTKDPFVATLDLKSVQTLSCAGAVLGDETQNILQGILGSVSVIQGYGMTEGGMTSVKPILAREKAGSVGSLLPNVELRIVDDDLKDVPTGASGEILTRGPTTFLGYRKNPEATAEAYPFGDGWMRTGDVGYMDKDGFLWLTDRKKELIKYKGNQVAPAELEDIILQYPDVLECAVCATWDDKQETEIPVAYVNLKPTVAATEREATLREIRAFVDQRVASYKKLRGGVEYLAQIPRNPTGKILRRLLPAQIALEAKAAAAKRKGKL